jgi:hypothetical protein
MMGNSPLRLLLTFWFAVLLAACSSDGAEAVVVGQDVADTAAPSEETSSSTSSTSATSTTSEAPTTTDTTTPETTTTDPVADETIEVLGPAMVGLGDWAVIRPVSRDDIDCSNDGTLAYLLDGEVVHRYDTLGGLGGVRLYNGPRGQDAFVINCEESVERVLVQGSAILPGTGWPELTDFRFYDSDFENFWMDYSGDYGWRGDMFAVHASTSADGETFDELFIFDPSAPSIEALHSRIGTRLSDVGVPGVDLISPTVWTVDAAGDIITSASSDSSSRVQVLRQSTEATVPPLAEGDELLSSDEVMVRLWSVPDAEGHARVVSMARASEWFYLAEDGLRLVRQIPIGDDVVEIEMYADDADGAPSRDLPWLSLEMIRVFDEAP